MTNSTAQVAEHCFWSILPFYFPAVLFAAEDSASHTTPAMWGVGSLFVAIVVVIAILGLIFRDAMNDEANWLHAVGALGLWIVLVLLVQGFQRLEQTLRAESESVSGAGSDLFFLVGFTIIFFAFTPVLVLLGLVVGKTCWKIRQDRMAANRARQLRGTLSEK